MKIYILRHEDRTMDATFFSPLTSEGLNNSVKLIEILKKHNIDKIYSSPFIRTLQTVTPYSKSMNIPINLDYSLSEIQHPHIIPEKSYQITLPLYIAESFNYNPKYTSLFNPVDYKYPENEKLVEKRVKRFMGKILTDELKSKHNILIVSHQVVCNIILKFANRNTDVNLDVTHNYPRGGLTQVFNKDEWVFEPINWEYNVS